MLLHRENHVSKRWGGRISVNLNFQTLEESEVFAVYFIWLSRHMFLIYFVLGRFFYLQYSTDAICLAFIICHIAPLVSLVIAVIPAL